MLSTIFPDFIFGNTHLCPDNEPIQHYLLITQLIPSAWGTPTVRTGVLTKLQRTLPLPFLAFACHVNNLKNPEVAELYEQCEP